MMNYKNIVIFTKTKWEEPPRIRHQLARLLASYGHDITFFEKSSLAKLKVSKNRSENIDFIRHFELLHHQLRPFGFLIKLNQFITKIIIKKLLKKNKIDLIVNFNYDYSFLQKLFPDVKIVTIINDDFIAQAKPWMGKSIEKQLVKTCVNSDSIFTVSYPLQRQLKNYNSKTYLLFPWTTHKYESPQKNKLQRDTVLYWGFIDSRIDWDVVRYLVKNKVKLRFVGDISANVENIVAELNLSDNFELASATLLDNLNLDDVCCSLLAYDVNIQGIKSVSISNRAFQLLSYGVPLVYSDLPELIQSPKSVISKCKENKDFKIAIDTFKSQFYEYQDDIELFLKDHYSESRYKFFMEKMDAETS